MKVFAIAILLLSLGACNGGFEEDPFINEAPDVRNGQIQDKQKLAKPPLDKVVKVDIDVLLQVDEGEELVIPFKFRELHPDIELQDYRFRDLEEVLPGASLDKAKRILTWTPAVEEDFQGVIDRRLLVMEVFLAENGQPRIFEKTLSIDVFRPRGYGPQIISAKKATSRKIEEGQVSRVIVRLIDPTASAARNPVAPDLFMVPVGADKKSPAGFMYVNGTPRYNSRKKEFTYEVAIDLTAAEITKNQDNFKVGFFAFSGKSGLRSKIVEFPFTVQSSVTKPVFTSFKNAKFYVGQTSTYSFQVFDPKEEGVVEAGFKTRCNRIASGANCTCVQERTFLSKCSLEWTPEQAGRVVFDAEASNKIGSRLSKSQQTHELLVLDPPKAPVEPESPAQEAPEVSSLTPEGVMQ